MNRGTIGILTLALLSTGGALAGSSASPRGQSQVSKDKSQVKSDAAQGSADEKEVKRLSGVASEAGTKSREAHQVYLEKLNARKAAEKSYGAKDARTQQAFKDEAAAKQDWETDLKQQQEADAQRKAAIAKLHSADTGYKKDVGKMDSDESQKKTPPQE